MSTIQHRHICLVICQKFSNPNLCDTITLQLNPVLWKTPRDLKIRVHFIRISFWVLYFECAAPFVQKLQVLLFLYKYRKNSPRDHEHDRYHSKDVVRLLLLLQPVHASGPATAHQAECPVLLRTAARSGQLRCAVRERHEPGSGHSVR